MHAYNVDEIDDWCQCHQHFTSYFFCTKVFCASFLYFHQKLNKRNLKDKWGLKLGCSFSGRHFKGRFISTKKKLGFRINMNHWLGRQKTTWVLRSKWIFEFKVDIHTCFITFLSTLMSMVLVDLNALSLYGRP